MNGTVMREILLPKGRITIGRGSQNDIVLDDLAISGHHAAIVSTENDSYLEDLNSTNGTQVNGQPVRKHFLQDEDVIGLARYRLRYLNDLQVDSALGAETLMGKDVPEKRELSAIRILNGTNAGKETSIVKEITTIGRLDRQIAMITRRSDGFYLSQVEGMDCPLINGCPVSLQGQRLEHKDVINIAGTQIEFLSLAEPF